MERGYAYVKSDLGVCRIAYDDPTRWEVVESSDPEGLTALLDALGFEPARAPAHPDRAVRMALYAASALPGGELSHAENTLEAEAAHERLRAQGVPV